MSHVLEQVQCLNPFLKAIYQTPHRLSDILHDTGLSEQELHRLRPNSLEPYLAELLHRWRAIFPSFFHSQRRADILIRRSGLDGTPLLPLQQLGEI